MIHQDPASDSGCRMNIDSKDLRNPVLKMQSQQLPALFPKPMRDPVADQSVNTFQEKEWYQTAGDCRIAILHGLNVGAHSMGNIGIFRHCFEDDLSQLHGGQSTGRQFAGNVKADSIFEAFVVQNCGMQEAGQHGLGGCALGCTLTN